MGRLLSLEEKAQRSGLQVGRQRLCWGGSGGGLGGAGGSSPLLGVLLAGAGTSLGSSSGCGAFVALGFGLGLGLWGLLAFGFGPAFGFRFWLLGRAFVLLVGGIVFGDPAAMGGKSMCHLPRPSLAPLWPVAPQGNASNWAAPCVLTASGSGRRFPLVGWLLARGLAALACWGRCFWPASPSASLKPIVHWHWSGSYCCQSARGCRASGWVICYGFFELGWNLTIERAGT